MLLMPEACDSEDAGLSEALEPDLKGKEDPGWAFWYARVQTALLPLQKLNGEDVLTQSRASMPSAPRTNMGRLCGVCVFEVGLRKTVG